MIIPQEARAEYIVSTIKELVETRAADMTGTAVSRKRAAYRPSLEFVPEVLAGSRLAIARMISRAEGGYTEAAEALAQIYKHTPARRESSALPVYRVPANPHSLLP